MKTIFIGNNNCSPRARGAACEGQTRTILSKIAARHALSSKDGVLNVSSK